MKDCCKKYTKSTNRIVSYKVYRSEELIGDTPVADIPASSFKCPECGSPLFDYCICDYPVRWKENADVPKDIKDKCATCHKPIRSK